MSSGIQGNNGKQNCFYPDFNQHFSELIKSDVLMYSC